MNRYFLIGLMLFSTACSAPKAELKKEYDRGFSDGVEREISDLFPKLKEQAWEVSTLKELLNRCESQRATCHKLANDCDTNLDKCETELKDFINPK